MPLPLPRRPRGRTLAAALGCVLLSVAGCSSSGGGSATTSPSVSPSPSASASASPTSAPTTASPSASESASASASPSASGSATATAATVTIKNFAFNPANLTVAPGTTITVLNQDGIAHTMTSTQSGAFDTGPFAGGATATITAPTAPGSYPYICTIHPFMTGTLTVK